MNRFKGSLILKIFAFIGLILFVVLAYYTVKNTIVKTYGTFENFDTKYELQYVKYTFDGENFKDFSEFENEDKYSKKSNMVVTGIIDSEFLRNPVLYIKTKNNYYDIYIDGERFLVKEKVNVLNTFTSIDFKGLSKNADGKTIEIYLYSNKPQNIAKDFEIYTTNKFFVVTNLIFDGLSSMMFSVFTIVSGTLLITSSISKRYRYYGMHIIGYFSVLIGIIWIFSFNELTILFVDNLYLISFLTSISIAQVPVAILLFTQKYERNRLRKARYRSAINLYLFFLLGVLLLEILDIINIQDFNVYIAIIIAGINLVSLGAFFDRIKNRKLYEAENAIARSRVTDKRVKVDNFNDSIFSNHIPYVFIVFLGINLVGSILFAVTANQIYYVVAIGISALLLLLFCGALFSQDLKKINNSAVTDQERRILNKKRIDLLVEEQAKLFNEDNIDSICDKFTNNIKGILFPYGNIEKNKHKITSAEIREKYIADYKTFSEVSSSLVYVIMPDEENINNSQHKIFAGTGEYEKYVSKDPQKVMDKNEFSKMLFIMKGIREVENSDIAVVIGSTNDSKGIILFKNIGDIEPYLKGLLESYVRTCTILIENLKLIADAKSMQHDTVYNLNEISELRSKETGYHIKRVSLYSALLGKKLGMNSDEIEILQLASSMHDIGKISIPDKILNKPGKLTDEEFDVMKTHAEIGYDILKNTTDRVMKVGAIVAKYHHERYNGRGYYGLTGEEIPKIARIVAVADVFDALSVTRVYKDAWPLEKIIDLFKKERGEHFDKDLVDILFEHLGEFLEIRDRYKEDDE